MNSLLEVNDLSIGLKGMSIVDKVSFSIEMGETLALVGESGCGKTMTAMSILKLLPESVEISGEINFNNQSLLSLKDKDLRKIRGNSIGMVFQEPMSSLNPVFTIGNQISETLRIHLGMNKKDALEKSAELLESVGISNSRKIVRDYPHQLSGGMRQRVMIAMAIACNPKLIIADEPTTALDVTIQAQILDLIIQLKEEHRTSMLLISHNLGVVNETSQKICVMYLGQIVEMCTTKELFDNAHHPYSKGLLKSTPQIGKKSVNSRLYTIKGEVPSFKNIPKGCRFNSRCEYAIDECFLKEPELNEKKTGHFSRCYLDV